MPAPKPMNPTTKPAEYLTGFLLEQISQQPADRRIALYLCLASETKDGALRAQCHAMARELEAIVRKEEQMLLDFRRRNS